MDEGMVEYDYDSGELVTSGLDELVPVTQTLVQNFMNYVRSSLNNSSNKRDIRSIAEIADGIDAVSIAISKQKTLSNKAQAAVMSALETVTAFLSEDIDRTKANSELRRYAKIISKNRGLARRTMESYTSLRGSVGGVAFATVAGSMVSTIWADMMTSLAVMVPILTSIGSYNAVIGLATLDEDKLKLVKYFVSQLSSPRGYYNIVMTILSPSRREQVLFNENLDPMVEDVQENVGMIGRVGAALGGMFNAAAERGVVQTRGSNLIQGIAEDSINALFASINDLTELLFNLTAIFIVIFVVIVLMHVYDDYSNQGRRQQYRTQFLEIEPRRQNRGRQITGPRRDRGRFISDRRSRSPSRSRSPFSFGVRKRRSVAKKRRSVAKKRRSVAKKRRSVAKKRRSVAKKSVRKFSRKKSFGMYGDPVFGKVDAKNIKAKLTPYYEYKRNTFPLPGGIREEVGSGFKNTPVHMGPIYPGPFYSSYNV